MPFTLSHAAAVLPVRKVGFVTSAFVIGTLAPDFEYFIRLRPQSGFGHHWPGVVVFTIPASILALWLFHTLIKRPAATLLPSALETRLLPYLGRFRFGGLRRFGWILLSVIAGIGSHLLWDVFTHRNTFATEHWPLLDERIVVPVLGSQPLFNVLQHVSTVLGLFALAVWFLLWVRSAYPMTKREHVGLRDSHRLGILCAIVGAAVLGALVRVFLLLQGPQRPTKATHVVVALGVTSISFFVCALLAYAIWWTSSKKLRNGDRAMLNN